MKSVPLISGFKTLSRLARRKWLWIGLGLLSILLRLAAGQWPKVTEALYSRFFFVGVRGVLDYTIGWLPFSLVYLLLAGLLGLLTYLTIRRIRIGPGPGSKWARFLRGLHGVIAFLGGAIFFFLVLWGYNYQREPVEAYFGLETHPLNATEIQAGAEWAAMSLAHSREAISSDTFALKRADFPENLDQVMRTSLSKVLEAQGYPAPGRVRIKPVWPGGAMMRFGVAGIYIPYTGQGCIPADQPWVDRPFTLAHEMSHGMGFGDEGTCNFLAFLACEGSGEEAIIYSGRLNYWSYISRELYRSDPEEYAVLREDLPIGVRADLRVLRDYSRKYRSFLTDLGYRVNNGYLKSQGVTEGIESYNRMVVLVEAWRER